MPLILKRASISRPSGQWSDSDFDVLADSKAIGRIYEDAHLSTPPELRWFWSATAILAGSPFRLHRTLPPIPSRPTSVRP
jgi:hypothetical protein